MTLLVDTYDTEEGVRVAARVLRDLDRGPGSAVRLDSGDLGSLAVRARSLLDDSGLPDVRIVASGGLDEYSVDDLVRSGAPIDTYAVGTRIGVSADAPYLDSAYKLVEFDGHPVMKLSSAKVTAPGRKQVFRRPGCADEIALADEQPPRRQRSAAGDGDAERAAHRQAAHARRVPGKARRGPGRAALGRAPDPSARRAPGDDLRATERTHGPRPATHRRPDGSRLRTASPSSTTARFCRRTPTPSTSART